jgi:hypothetical protein
VKGSALSASCLTSLTRSAINSSMQLHPNQEVFSSCLLLGRVNGVRQLGCGRVFALTFWQQPLNGSSSP